MKRSACAEVERTRRRARARRDVWDTFARAESRLAAGAEPGAEPGAESRVPGHDSSGYDSSSESAALRFRASSALRSASAAAWRSSAARFICSAARRAACGLTAYTRARSSSLPPSCMPPIHNVSDVSTWRTLSMFAGRSAPKLCIQS